MSKKGTSIRHTAQGPAQRIVTGCEQCPVCGGDVWFVQCKTCDNEHYQCDTCMKEYIARPDGWFRREADNQLTFICKLKPVDKRKQVDLQLGSGETISAPLPSPKDD